MLKNTVPVVPMALTAFWDQLPEWESGEHTRKPEVAHVTSEQKYDSGMSVDLDEPSRFLSPRKENTDVRDALIDLKNDIIRALRISMRTELDGNLEKLKIWTRDTLLKNMVYEKGTPLNSAVDVVPEIHVATRIAPIFPEEQGPSLLSSPVSRKASVMSNPSVISSTTEEFRYLEELITDVRTSMENMSRSTPDVGPRPSEKIDISLSDSASASTKAALEVVARCPLWRLQEILENGDLSPDFVFGELQLNGKKYTHCSLLAAAVLCSQPDKVKLLVKMGADPDSDYGFVSGSTKQKWSYPASSASIAQNNTSMLRLLLALRANPDAEATNGANMVWQCAYFGRDNMLEFLLSSDLSEKALNKSAESQNQSGVTHSPLHISVNMGQENCSRLLLKAKALINDRNEEMESPLDAAIRCGCPELVTLLVQEGAQVVEVAESQKPRKSPIPEESEFIVPGVDQIFNKREPNPIMVHAVAVGLQSQPEQVAALKISHVLNIWEIDRKSMIAMLNALFVERHIRFRAKTKRFFIKERRTALLWRDERVKGIDSGYRHSLVVSTSITFADLNALVKSGTRPTEKELDFIRELIPNKSNPSACGFLDNFLNSSRQHTPIVVNECLVPTIHKDLRFLKVIADSGPVSEIYSNRHCQAIITYVWSRSQGMAILHCLVHFMLLLYFMFLATAINFESWNSHFSSSILLDYIRIVSFIMVPCWLFELLSESLELTVYVEYGWTLDYLTDLTNIFDITRVLSDGSVLFFFLIYGIGAADAFFFRCFTASVCMLKWTKLLYCFTPFRLVGLPVMPILFTLQDIGSAVGISIVFLSGMAHAVIVLDIIPHDNGFTPLHAFNFGITGHVDKFMDFFSPQDPDVWVNIVLQLVGCLGLFTFPITLMNIFIASMSSSYEHGMTKMENLYQNRCAQAAFSHACVRYALNKRFCCHESDEKSPHRLWYCCSRDRLYDQSE